MHVLCESCQDRCYDDCAHYVDGGDFYYCEHCWSEYQAELQAECLPGGASDED